MDNETKNVGWNFDNSYTELPKKFYASVNPTPVTSPKLIIFNSSLAKSLGLNDKTLQGLEGIETFAGNRIPEGASPLAQPYAGHQFGHFTMLGDGRAHLLGEQITPDGERYDIQLKGSGETPFSRSGDGRAVLGPMLREYIISEAMHALGIPSSRSLAVVSTGEKVIRETKKPGAILTRVAKSHIRVGTFQYAAQWRSEEELRELADYTINRHYPEVANDENPYLSLFKKVLDRQAKLLAQWQLVGFIHGVMNTDNMTISGESIDYGPCAFMNTYDRETVFSSIDVQGRYAFGNQPRIGEWNLARFAESLLSLFDEDQDKAVEIAQDALGEYPSLFGEYWMDGMRKKLGIFDEKKQDKELIETLLDLMEEYKADYTNTFLALTFDRLEDSPLHGKKEFSDWYKKWQERLEGQKQSKDESKQLMKSNNPAVIPRNHRVEEALSAAERGDLDVMNQLLDVLRDPYAHTSTQAEYSKPPEPSSEPYRTFCGT
ncbi:YdiU family protein [Halalkalibacillus sediminis]|uniref:Protein nucleotidyltransferase YdiU n=1 Tax=Halalkalibacillus sediminis TaxID=2018042 RepID=A0A2I0QR01_9BACI|nr:YdiU family protein [Halalkalibacillus sediminis]PKR76761.1 YdiU family protein [Halalkalibacillus sediminis]